MIRRANRYEQAGVLVLALAAVIYTAPAIAIRATAAGPCGPPVVSIIACENSLPGTPVGDWGIAGAGDPSIAGFATDISVNVGGTVHFKINTPASSYHFDILRMGNYGGAGARKVAAGLLPTASLPQNQPACLNNAPTGLIDCGNWAESASWAVPSTAVSGIYFAHLVRNDTLGESHIFFVVRNDASHSDLLVQTSDSTWQAYNQYGGNSLYVGGPGTNPSRAYKVSYNRPITNASTDSRNWVLNAEYPMVRFLEANGYDVSYTTDVDSDRLGPLIKQHKVFISSGHDEYWSGNQRANVEAARDAGTSLAFFSGNSVFWKTRWENSIDGTNTAYRTLVCYKETHANAAIDPQDPTTWTGTWRDPRFSPPADGGRPDNGLKGTYFTVNSGTYDIQVPAAYGAARFWRNTSVASLAPGTVATLAPGAGTLGYEWDEDVDNGFRPSGLIDLSFTQQNVPEKFIDYGHSIAPRTAIHQLTLYRVSSGALVFSTGSVNWAFGLDPANPNGTAPDPRMQQATVNLFADMGAQPFAVLPGLVAAAQSTDTTPPTSTITSPAAGASFQDGASVTITGTAADSGGVVAGVEVSTDGGSTWHPASGRGSWSYTWVAHGSPTTTIKSRAIDDSGNLESLSAGISVNVSCPCSLWGNNSPIPDVTSDPDNGSIEVGVKFRADVDGLVSGIRFYKGTQNTGTHIANLWTGTGTLLATATFAGETASGWQQVNFASPVAIFSNTTYVASYFAPQGHYADNINYFFGAPPLAGTKSTDSPPLHALNNGVNGPNGVFSYGTGSTFPTNNNADATNFWVDVVFNPNNGPPVVLSTVPGAGASGASQTAPVTATFNKSIDPATLSFSLKDSGGTMVAATVSYNGTTRMASLQPNASLAARASYTASVSAADPAGHAMPSPFIWSFTTAGSLTNGGFETGSLSPWVTGGVVPPVVSTAQPHAGTYSALLGTISGPEANGDSSLSQGFTVPTGSPTLTFWYWTVSTDSLCSGSNCAYDWIEGQIRSPSGSTLASIFKLNSNSQTWTQVTFDMTPYAGQGVTLWFNVHLDGSVPPDDTAMYLDDVAVTGSGPTAPGPPTNVIATAGNAQATVSWTAPANNGGSPITGYTVTSSPGGVTAPAGASATSATVSPLVNGTSYTFTVTATNAVGTSSPSVASNAVIPAAPPGPPTNVTATAGNAQATVSWTAPASNGGSPITGYTVTSSPGGVTASAGASATSAVVSPLVNGTSYTFTVTASNAVGTSSPSTASNAVTPGASAPGPPTNVTAVAGNAQATVSWTAPANNGGSPITGYTVTSSPGGVTAPAGASATSAVVSPLVNGTSYTFTVTASNAVGTSSPSAASNAVIPATAPGPPTNVTATAGNAQATVSWTAPASNGGSPITGYTVTSSPGGVTASAGASATSAVVSPLANGTTYTFTVTASNAVGTSSPSAASNTVTPAPTAPGPPTNVTATAGNAQATVSWTAPANNGGSPITGYTVTSSPGGVTAPAGASATSAVVSPLVNGTPYTFTVTASNAVGTSSPSTASNAVTPSAYNQITIDQTVVRDGHGTVTTPAFTTAGAGELLVAFVSSDGPLGGSQTVTISGAGLAWTLVRRTNTQAGSTEIWTATASTQLTGATVTSTQGTTAFDQSLTVLALKGATGIGNSAGASSGSGAPSVTVTTTRAGSLVYGVGYDWDNAVARTLGPNQVMVHQWVNTATGDTYWAQGASSQTPTSGTAVQLNDTAPTTDRWNFAAVEMLAGLAPPGPPTNVTAVAGNAQATVSWTAPANNGGSPITGYTVTSSPGGVTAPAGASATSAVVSPLVNGTSYTFTVTASNAVGTSSPSAASNAVIPAAPPGPPTNVTATAGNAFATVSWTAPASNGGSPITGYTVTSSPGGVTASAGGSATSVVVSPLVNGTSYTFTVTASNAVGTSSPSVASNAVTPAPTAPGPPTNVTAVAGNAQATVSWTAPANNGGSPITGYTVTSSPGGVTAPAGASATSAVVSPLVNGTPYTFTVTATNSVGTSSPSAPSNAVTPTAYNQITIDQTAIRDGIGTVTTPAFTTAGAGEVLVAFVGSDGPLGSPQTVTVSGAGLAWTLVRRTNTQAGSTEIWTATASTQLTGATVTSTQGTTGYSQSLTVLALKGATGIGNSAGASSGSGAPSVTVTTTRAGSLVYGVGYDWDRAVARTLGPNQVMAHQWVNTGTGDTYWVQGRNSQTPASGTAVQLNDTAPTTDRWNFAAVELLAI